MGLTPSLDKQEWQHRVSYMETDGAEARGALAEVERIREANEQRLRRPGRYWMMVGGFFAVYALAPLIYDVVPEPYGYVLPVALVPVIAVAFLWRRPRDMRIRYTLDGGMLRLLIGFAVLCAVIVGTNTGLYGLFGWWWLPPLAAVVMFLVGFLGGRAMDRRWARTVSRRA